MATVPRGDFTVTPSSGELSSLKLLVPDATVMPKSSDGESYLLENQHFHEFDGKDGTCECGQSVAAYDADADKSICPVVLDALFDPLPMPSV